MMLKGLDLSHHNVIYSYAAINAQADFVVHKATQGTNFVDNTFRTRIKRFRKETNVVFGAYHWLMKGNGAAQARFFIKTVKSANGGTLDGVMMVVDVEATTWIKNANAQFNDLEAFYDEFYRLTNRTLVVYTSPGYWNKMIASAAKNKRPRPHKNRIPNTVLWQAYWVVSSKGRDLKDTPPPANNSPAWVPLQGKAGYRDLAMLQTLKLVRINGKGKYDGNVSKQSKAYLRSLTREGKPEDNGSGNPPTPCPTGYHREEASGICVPDKPSNDDDQQGDGNDDTPGGGDVSNENYIASVTTAGVAGVGGGAMLGIGATIVLVTIIYLAIKGGSKASPVVDRGERD